MNVYSTTLMVDKKNNCEKKDAELLLLGAKRVNLDEYVSLKYVFRAGIGSDKIPIEEIEARGIRLFFPSAETRNLISEAVARLAFGSIVTAATVDRDIKSWYREPRKDDPKILIYGAGHVGGRVAEMCGDIGMCVTTYDVKDQYWTPTLDHFDIISFHVPLVAYEHGSAHRDNRNLIGRELLSRCKSGVTLINTSRGGIASEGDIAEFLLCHPKAKYITDVYAEEPYSKENPLHPHLNKQFFGTPHIASYTKGAREALTNDVNTLIEELD